MKYRIKEFMGIFTIQGLVAYGDYEEWYDVMNNGMTTNTAKPPRILHEEGIPEFRNLYDAKAFLLKVKRGVIYHDVE